MNLISHLLFSTLIGFIVYCMGQQYEYESSELSRALRGAWGGGGWGAAVGRERMSLGAEVFNYGLSHGLAMFSLAHPLLCGCWGIEDEEVCVCACVHAPWSAKE